MDLNGTTLLHTEALSSTREAAVLFAAKFDQAAEQLLRERLEPGGERSDRVAWVMLLEIFHALGRRDEFEALARRYRTAFGAPTPPAWGFPAQVSSPGTFHLKGTIASSGDLAGLVGHARARATVAIDMGQVERIDYGFAASFCELLRVFHMQGKRVFLANIAEVHAALLESLGAGKHVVLLRRKSGFAAALQAAA